MISNDTRCNVQDRTYNPKRSTLEFVTVDPDRHGSVSDLSVAHQGSIAATPHPLTLNVFTSPARVNAPWACASSLNAWEWIRRSCHCTSLLPLLCILTCSRPVGQPGRQVDSNEYQVQHFDEAAGNARGDVIRKYVALFPFLGCS